MQTQPAVAVVILNWNGRKFLQQFLPSVLASTYPNLRIIVADNASTDDSVAYVEQIFPTVEVLISKENYGFAKGYNHFLQKVQSDYYILLNSDVEVEQGWIEPVISLMESDASIAACQPKLLAYHNKTEFEYAGAGGGWIDMLGYPFSRGRVFDELEKDEGQYNNATPIFWASGAALFIRADRFHAMQGFDPFFFAHQEEIDLCWRLQRAGYKIYVCPQSVVYHVGGGTLPTGSNRKVYLNFRNNLVMITKNMPWSELWWKLPLRLALDGLSAWKELLAGKGGYWLAVYNAHMAFCEWALGRQKRNTQAYPVLQTVYKGSVVYQYFLKKKKKFSEIVKQG
ncbi:glycosyltransferase family 2 protein [Lacibacter luteus]|uniref:Glycosyltransferase family 2 protein n=1 Tax=Lacibacter luteus TaxID=2508719 RepID=A0A4Q1CFK8_9BACT|nr:glycosyltransferase family 2 protein [Lacibacter luteus]RXK58427.1 glycosyltransferase family 2 protein [Lacibacter luteus]